jgi:hypothetical protein
MQQFDSKRYHFLLDPHFYVKKAVQNTIEEIGDVSYNSVIYAGITDQSLDQIKTQYSDESTIYLSMEAPAPELQDYTVITNISLRGDYLDKMLSAKYGDMYKSDGSLVVYDINGECGLANSPNRAVLERGVIYRLYVAVHNS